MLGPTLETPRLILRPPESGDIEGWAGLMGDPEASRFIGGVQPRPAAWRSLASNAGMWALKGFGMFSLVEKENGRWIGWCGPWQPEGWPGTEVGWSLLRDVWGRGYATEAAGRAVGWAFEALGWDDVIHCIDPANAASEALARRLGSTNRGPGKLPPPFENAEINLWGQTREQWRQRANG